MDSVTIAFGDNSSIGQEWSCKISIVTGSVSSAIKRGSALAVAMETSEVGGTAMPGSHTTADTRTVWVSDQLYGVKVSLSDVSCDSSVGLVRMRTMTSESGSAASANLNEAGALPGSKLV